MFLIYLFDMKATIEFNLDNLWEREAHLRAVKATDMAIAIFEITANARRRVEQEIESSEEPLDNSTVLDMVFLEIAKILGEQGIEIDNLIS